MGKLRSKEVSNDLLGPMGRRIGMEVKANTLASTHPISPQVHLKSKGKGSFLRCRGEQGKEGKQTENGSTSIISIRKTVSMVTSIQLTQ